MKIVLTQYDKTVKDRSLTSLKGVSLNKGVSWLHITGKGKEVVEELKSKFDFHTLLLEDLVHAQRPKIEDFGDAILMIVKVIRYEDKQIHTDQLALVVGKTYVLSIQEKTSSLFDQVRDRLNKNNKGFKAGYIAYSLLDSIVDKYFDMLEEVGDDIENVEAELLHRPLPRTLNKLHHLKRSMLLVRRAVWPLRELVNEFGRDENKFVSQYTRFHLRDLYDHVVEIMDTVETYREMLTGLLDIYLSSISNKMNEVMKVLTVIATIFIPLTFVTGLYGMNFRYMPELTQVWAYPAVLVAMLVAGVAMWLYFKKRKWV